MCIFGELVNHIKTLILGSCKERVKSVKKGLFHYYKIISFGENLLKKEHMRVLSEMLAATVRFINSLICGPGWLPVCLCVCVCVWLSDSMHGRVSVRDL